MSTPASTVLVVDDTPANLGVMCDALTAAGFRVLVAESGPRALELLRRGPVDLVLLDVLMPGLDGFATQARIREVAEWVELPVIFLTAVDTPEEKVRAFAAGAVDYVNKPVHAPEVVARVRTHLELRAARRELERKNEVLAAEIALRLDADEQLAASLDRALLVVDVAGKILFQTHLATHLLHKHRPGHAPGIFPPELLTGAGPLRVRRFTEAATTETSVVFLEEERPAPGPAALRVLGLTPRESEVLYWIAQGKSNPEIALILAASRRTVSTHVEHILAKLGVENRASAVMAAAEVLHRA